jgi:hypothetical protein
MGESRCLTAGLRRSLPIAGVGGDPCVMHECLGEHSKSAVLPKASDGAPELRGSAREILRFLSRDPAIHTGNRIGQLTDRKSREPATHLLTLRLRVGESDHRQQPRIVIGNPDPSRSIDQIPTCPWSGANSPKPRQMPRSLR